MNAKVLIVEDEELIRKSYAEELVDEGFAVLQAKNGQEGLEIALKEKPDIILLDILMPVMDGLSMMNKLRQDPGYGKHASIMMLTNLSAGEEKVMASITKHEPAYYFIKSDWNLSDVIQKIREQLAYKVSA